MKTQQKKSNNTSYLVFVRKKLEFTDFHANVMLTFVQFTDTPNSMIVYSIIKKQRENISKENQTIKD